MTIDIMDLPNNALLKIFDFFVDGNDDIGAWHPLVHVCRKWRNIAFGSPRHLNLDLRCTAGKQAVRELLDTWPDLPIVVKLYDPPTTSWGVDNVVAAAAPLAHTDRVYENEISLGMHMVAISPLEVICAAMRVPFPVSIRLKFLPELEPAPIAPNDSFLGRSSPRLRSLYLGRVPFPGLPALLLSSTDLVRLTLRHIPYSGYNISPDTMVRCLSVLTSLESLCLEFEFPRPRRIQNTGRPPPQTRSALPALTYFSFRGVTEYLEDLVARIDTPFLEELHIMFFHQLTLDTSQLAQLISRTPNLNAHNEAQVVFLDDAVQVLLGSMQQISIRTTCKAPDWQLSFVSQVCNSSLSLIPSLEHLYICEDRNSRARWPDDIKNDQWLEVLHSFTNVKYLYLSEGIVPHIAPTLQELVERPGRLTEILPVLESLFLEEPHPSGLIDESRPSEPVQEAIRVFIAARRLSKRSSHSSRNWRERRTSVISQRFTGLFD